MPKVFGETSGLKAPMPGLLVNSYLFFLTLVLTFSEEVQQIHHVLTLPASANLGVPGDMVSPSFPESSDSR